MVDDFRVVQGFAFMTEFGLRLAEESHGQNQLIEHFVAIVKDLCVHGPNELRPVPSQSPFKLVSFQLPKPKVRFALERETSLYCFAEDIIVEYG